VVVVLFTVLPILFRGKLFNHTCRFLPSLTFIWPQICKC